MNTDVTCPFCGEKDFDLIGLKIHYERGYCDEYEDIPWLVHAKKREDENDENQDFCTNGYGAGAHDGTTLSMGSQTRY